MTVRAVPYRMEDVEFYWRDALAVSFEFLTTETPHVPVDLSNSAVEVRASVNGELVIPQPAIDLSEGSAGVVRAEWSLDQVKLLPRMFTLDLAERGILQSIPANLTWDDLDIAWDNLPDYAWEDGGVFGRTLLIGRLIRNDEGWPTPLTDADSTRQFAGPHLFGSMRVEAGSAI